MVTGRAEVGPIDTGCVHGNAMRGRLTRGEYNGSASANRHLHHRANDFIDIVELVASTARPGDMLEASVLGVPPPRATCITAALAGAVQ